MTVNLRPYQQQLVDGIRTEWSAGNKDVLAQMPCRSGKTVTFTSFSVNDPNPSCSIVHRQELIGQISTTHARMGVPHNIIAPQPVINFCIHQQIREVGRSFYDPKAPAVVAGVDTLIRRHTKEDRWCKTVKRKTVDEAHHALQTNKWGKAWALFPDAYGLGVTATPIRGDGKSLHRAQGGVFDALVQGIGMRDLIDMGNICEYRVIAPEPSIAEAELKIGTTGDFTEKSVRDAAHKSQIVGDAVATYLRFTPGRPAIAFTVDVAQAEEMAEKFRQAGVTALALDGKTPDAERQAAMDKFKRGEIQVLTNCELFSEGLDLPGVDVCIMARPTMSFGMYTQQFCLDPETEVLTPQGWRGIDDEISSVLAFDMSDDSVSVQPVTDRVRRPLYEDERMFGMRTKQRDICVSDRHDMISKSTSETAKNWQKNTAEEFAKFKGMRRIPVAGFGHFKGVALSDDELRFIGWFLSDGCLNKSNGVISISQSLGYPERIAELRATLDACGFKYGEYVQKRPKGSPDTHHDLLRFSLSPGAPKGKRKHLRGWGHLRKWLDKSIPPAFDDLTRDEFRQLMHGVHMGDGTKMLGADRTKMRGTIACGDNYHLADRLQALAVVRGFRANIGIVKSGHGGAPECRLHFKDVATVTIAGVNKKNGVMPDGRRYKRSQFGEIRATNKEVWCLTNPLGTLITRRNGKVVIMGNCRPLTPDPESGKTHGVIIDHVGNTLRMAAKYGMPDTPRKWELWREQGRKKLKEPDAIPMRTCEVCTLAFERLQTVCPFCGHEHIPQDRGAPEMVDGILAEMSPQLLEQLRMARAQITTDPAIPYGASVGVADAIRGRHQSQIIAQNSLRETMEFWGGVRRAAGDSDSQIQARFFHRFGVDVFTAQGLKRKEALALRDEIKKSLT